MPLAATNNSMKQNGSIKFWSIIFIESWVFMSQRVYKSMSQRVSAVTQTHKMKANPNPKLLLYWLWVSLAHDSLTHKTSVPIFILFWILGKYLDNNFNAIQNFKNVHNNTVVKYKFKKRTNKTLLFSFQWQTLEQEVPKQLKQPLILSLSSIENSEGTLWKFNILSSFSHVNTRCWCVCSFCDRIIHTYASTINF